MRRGSPSRTLQRTRNDGEDGSLASFLPSEQGVESEPSGLSAEEQVEEEGLPSRLRINPRHPGLLHLTPCTFDEYTRLGYDSTDRYELVQGILVWTPVMGDTEHGMIISWLKDLITFLPPKEGRDVYASGALPLRLCARDDSIQTQGRTKTHGILAESEDISRNGEATARYPDLMVVNRETDSSGSEATRSPSRGVRRPAMREAAMVVEVTSLKNSNDLNRKKREYEEAGIPEYVIIDRKKGRNAEGRCVIVHTLNRRGQYKTSVHTGRDLVECSYFSEFNLRACDMLDYKALDRKVKEKKKEQNECTLDLARIIRAQQKIIENQETKEIEQEKVIEEQRIEREEVIEEQRIERGKVIEGQKKKIEKLERERRNNSSSPPRKQQKRRSGRK